MLDLVRARRPQFSMSKHDRIRIVLVSPTVFYSARVHRQKRTGWEKSDFEQKEKV